MRSMEDRTPGWVLWHRQVIDKGYDAETYMVWSYLVLLANHKETNFHRIKVKRGQYLTSIREFSGMTKISVNKIRRIWDYLAITHQITIKKTNKFSIITINNYHTYQTNNTVNHTQTAHRQHTDSTPLITNNDSNNKEGFSSLNEIMATNNVDEQMGKLLGVWRYYNKAENKAKPSKASSIMLQIGFAINSGFSIENIYKRFVETSEQGYAEWEFFPKKKNSDIVARQEFEII